MTDPAAEKPASPPAESANAPAIPVPGSSTTVVPSLPVELGDGNGVAPEPAPKGDWPAEAEPSKLCLVTGANGFVGSWLVERLVTAGHRVRIICRASSDLKWLAAVEGKYEKIFGDLTEPDSLAKAATDCQWIFHIGGLTAAPSEARYKLVNAEGTGNVMAAAQSTARDTLQRLIYVSSLAAGGPAKSRQQPKTEATPNEPMSAYGRSKLGGEVRLKEIAARDDSREWPWVILRPPAVYGPRDKDVFEFFRMIQRGIRPTIGWPQMFTSVIHVHDLVEACVAAAQAPAERVVGETFYVANPDPFPFPGLMREMQRALGKSFVLPVFLPVWMLKIYGAMAWNLSRIIKFKPPVTYEKACELAPRYWICDPAKARENFGWQTQISIPDGFRDTVAWYREQRWL